MKKCILLFVSIVCFLFMVGFSNDSFDSSKKVNLYEDMVNSSVSIYNNIGYGAGVFIANDVVLTAAHVLRQPNLIIELIDGTTYKVDDFYIDEEEDVGFIFVDANEICVASLSLVGRQIGDTVYLVGTPCYRDMKFTISKGILSHLDRDIDTKWEDLLQTDAEGAGGSSGGPLYNSDGDVIGICVSGAPGVLTLCESAESISEAYERCLMREAR